MNIESLPSGFVLSEVFAEALRVSLISGENPLLCYYISRRGCYYDKPKKWEYYHRELHILSSKRFIEVMLNQDGRVETCRSAWLETIISISEKFFASVETYVYYPLTASGWSSDKTWQFHCEYGGGGGYAAIRDLHFVRDWKSYSRFRDALLTAVETRRAGGDVEAAVHQLLAARDDG